MSAAAILAPAGPVLDRREAAFFRDADPWGFILFARNVETPQQLRALTAGLRAAVGRDAPVLVDQEGGRVQRLRPPHWRQWPAPLDQAAAAGAVAARVMFLRAGLIAAELRQVGIDTNCAPCADVAGPATHPFLKNRCYGTDPGTVARLARATAEGLMAGGCLPVMKHMPGHGAARTDSHLHLPVVDADRATLAARDFAPFRALSDLPLAMTGHILYPAFDDARPATQSPELLRLIREDLGFGGLLMTDDLSMQALTGSLAERAGRAIAAGCDLALYCKGIEAEAAEVVAAAGAMTPAAEARAAAALALRPTTPGFDPAAALQEYLALTASGQG
jgi:beta-N-acetylhexosaminidase